MTDRICRGCGRPYEPAARGKDGPFHFCIVRLERTPDGVLRLVGHWRSGVWRDGAVLHQTVDDSVQRVKAARMEAAVSPEAELRGQRSLVVDPREVPAIVADACLWQA